MPAFRNVSLYITVKGIITKKYELPPFQNCFFKTLLLQSASLQRGYKFWMLYKKRIQVFPQLKRGHIVGISWENIFLHSLNGSWLKICKKENWATVRNVFASTCGMHFFTTAFPSQWKPWSSQLYVITFTVDGLQYPAPIVLSPESCRLRLMPLIYWNTPVKWASTKEKNNDPNFPFVTPV